MNLYLESGYFDFGIINQINVPFIYIYGPRGVGKTYGALKYVKEKNIKFMYSRRTQSELDLINKPDFSPWKKLNEDFGWHIGNKPITKYNAGFYEMTRNNDNTYQCQGEPIGYTSALSTISNMRGFDASDVEWWIYDEFIPESHVRPIREEGTAFLNAYETMNRNRELSGKKPIQVVCLANSNRLANPIFMELELVRDAERMQKKRKSLFINKERGFALIDTFDSPISELKENTALYKLSNKNSAFYKMALKNRFQDFDDSMQISRPLIEYKALFKIGEIVLYKHKSLSAYYCCDHVIGSPEIFGISDTEINRNKKKYSWVLPAYIDNKIEFEDYMIEALFNKYYHL